MPFGAGTGPFQAGLQPGLSAAAPGYKLVAAQLVAFGLDKPTRCATRISSHAGRLI